MKTKKLRRQITLASIAILMVSASQAADRWLAAGLVYRGGMDVRATGSSITQMRGVHGAGALSGPGSVGPADSYADRTYDDGYVNIDPGTGNPISIDPTVTWFWGYEGGGQYDAAMETLTFQRRGREGYTPNYSTMFDTDADMDGYGLEFVAGVPLGGQRTRCDLCVGVQGIFGAETSLSGSTYSEDLARLDVTDTYDVTGTTIPAPSHEGTYNGPFGTTPVIPSPVIPNQPDSRSTARHNSSQWAANQIALDVETDLYVLWVGPRFAWRATDALAVHLTPRLTGNFVQTHVARTETFARHGRDGKEQILQRWEQSESESDFFFGAGAVLGVDWETESGLFAGLWGGYDWVSDDTSVQVGPNNVTVDTSGYTGGARVGIRFGTAPEPAHTAALAPLEPLLRSVDEVLARDQDNAAPPHGEYGTAVLDRGHNLWTELANLLRVSGDRATVREMIDVIRTEHPDDLAALQAYARSRFSQSAVTCPYPILRPQDLAPGVGFPL